MGATKPQPEQKPAQNSDQVLDILHGGLLTVSQAAFQLQVGKSKLYDLMDQGYLPFCKIGRTRRIPARALADLAASSLTGGWKVKGAN